MNKRGVMGLGHSLVGLLLLSGAVACGAQDPDTGEDFEVLYDGLLGDKISGTNWGYWNTSPTQGNPTMIRVCFENPTSANATFRGWVRDAVERTWQRYGRVNFEYWGACSTTTVEPGIHILLTTSGGDGRVVPLLGSDGAGHIGKFALDGKRAQVGPDQGMWLRQGMAEARARNVAVHEFGHALGFWHEESRGDGPSNVCGDPDGIKATSEHYGNYDTGSIMSYCGGQAGGLQRLSANDIASLQRVYGRRVTGSIVSPRGYCMAANAWTSGSTGVRPFLWSCDEFQNDQEWRWSLSGSTISFNQLLSSDPGHTAAIQMVSSTDGSFIEVRDRVTSSYQWTMRNIEVRGYGAKCLTAPSTLGGALTMRECSSRANPPTRNANQRWDYFSGPGVLRRTDVTTQCAAVPNPSSPAAGDTLRTATCGGAGQDFPFASPALQYTNLRYTSGSTTLCLDVSGPNDAQFISGSGGPSEGAAVNLFHCSGPPNLNLNQQWNFTGTARALGKCLDRQNGGDGNGTRSWTWPCSSAASGDWVTNSAGQEWDFYWRAGG